MTSANHDRLAELGRRIIIAMGVPVNDITYETTLQLQDRATTPMSIKRIRADIYGAYPHEGLEAIVIEAGNTSPEKLRLLRDNGYLAIHLSYDLFTRDGINADSVEGALSRALKDTRVLTSPELNRCKGLNEKLYELEKSHREKLKALDAKQRTIMDEITRRHRNNLADGLEKFADFFTQFIQKYRKGLIY